jgi:septum formation protein
MAPTGEKLILASASAARAALLAAAGLAVAIEPAEIDETAVKLACGNPVECAARLAEMKALRVAERHPRALVIGADQILVCGEAWFDKPSDIAAAYDQLRALRGHMHELVTAVCVVQGAERIWHAVSRPRLTMREFSDAFLERYLAAEGASVLGSVGAYRLEGLGVQLFSEIEGDHFAILGLPLLALLHFLRDRGALSS